MPPLREVVAAGERLTREALGGPGEENLSGLEALQKRFTGDPEVQRLFLEALRHVGVDPERTYWDSLFLRFVPPVENGSGWEEQVGRIGVHRDTWSSNLLQQVNWWTTIRPLTADRTIAFFPAYWDRSLANTSADWDLDAIRKRRRAGESEVLPIVPEPAEPVDTSSELRVVLEPADLLCFSGAHLHATVPNVSGNARLSVELRTVSLDDLQRGRGAPDVDGRAPVVPLEWFRSMVDGAPLSGEDAR